MSKEPPEIIETKLTLSFGATLAINTGADGFSDWIRPATEFSTKWNGVPTELQLRMAKEYIDKTVLGPMLEEMIVLANRRLTEVRRGR